MDNWIICVRTVGDVIYFVAAVVTLVVASKKHH